MAAVLRPRLAPCALLVIALLAACAARPQPTSTASSIQAAPAPPGPTASAPQAARLPDDAGPADNAQRPDGWKAQRTYPPLVFTSEAYLHCSISSTKAGQQTMTTTSGQGFTFSSTMKPIGKSELELRGKGMRYKFDAFPAGPFPATFSGLGEGTITTMKAEVEVAVSRFQQPAGAGTEISFDASDIMADAAYVEFTGLWVRKADGKHFPFRLLFGHVSDGGGKVMPASPAPMTSIYQKMVVIGTPVRPATVTTSLFEEEADMDGQSGP
jgi:hypothetical protein